VETIVIQTILISIIICFLIISIVRKSNQIKKEKELIKSVTSLNRGTSSERELILGLLKNGIPKETIFMI
jgi:hypothetical protein